MIACHETQRLFTELDLSNLAKERGNVCDDWSDSAHNKDAVQNNTTQLDFAYKYI